MSRDEVHDVILGAAIVVLAYALIHHIKSAGRARGGVAAQPAPTVAADPDALSLSRMLAGAV